MYTGITAGVFNMKRAIKRLLAQIPTKLPQGIQAFEVWSNDIIDTYEMPNNDSIKFALATAVMHSTNGRGYIPKAYFGNVLLKGAANQVAYALMQDLKNKQEALAKAEQEKQQAEATASIQDVTASNEPQS